MAVMNYGDSEVDAIMWVEDMIPTLTTKKGAEDFFEKRREEEKEMGLEPGSFMDDYVSGSGDWVVLSETSTGLYETADEALKDFLEEAAGYSDATVYVDMNLFPKLKVDESLIRTIFGEPFGEEGEKITFKVV